MRENGVPQFTVDGHRAVRDFDLLGVSFATELGYTNLLEALDLAGIPMHAVDRDETHPVVVAGGHAAFNPEPVSDFVDCAVLGDGEQVVGDITDVVKAWKAQGRPGGRDELLARLARVDGVYVPRFYAVSYGPDGAIAERHAHPGRRPGQGRQAHRHGPRRVALPEDAAGAAGRERPRADERRDLPRLHPGLPVLPGRDDHPPGARADDHRHRLDGRAGPQGHRLRGGRTAVSLSSADHSEIGQLAKELADRYEGTNTSLSLPRTRVDAFNVTLANELSRNGRRSGLTFAPEGGSERIRRVINKTVSKEDLVRTVTTAYANGWRQVKLYFMCGLPTETDEDVLEIADLAVEVIRAGREASGQKDIRCTVSIGGFVPKPHTPFQWAAQASADTIDHRLRILRQKINEDRRIGRSIGLRYHDGKPGVIEGLLSRGDRRVGRVIERVWREGGKFDGWSEHFSFDRWTTAAAEELAPFGVDLDWFTTRERTEHEILPVGPPGLRPGQGVPLGRLAGGAQRGGGRRLPVDALLRLRRLPDHGHRDPDRPHRAQPAPAHRRLMARQPDGPAPAADGPEAAHPLRQARPAAVRLPPRPRPHARARAAPGPGADGVLGRVQPAPEDLLPRRRADRCGQRGRVPGDRAVASGATPRRSGPPWTPRCRRTSPSSSASRRRRGPARWPTGSTPRSGGWSCPA